MLDYKMIANIAVGIIVAMVVLQIGSALLYKSGVGSGKGRLHDKKAMIKDMEKMEEAMEDGGGTQ